MTSVHIRCWTFPFSRPTFLHGSSTIVKRQRPRRQPLRKSRRKSRGAVHMRRKVVTLHHKLVVRPTVNHVLLHAEVLARNERLTARGTGETVQVVHQVLGSHHQLVRGDSHVATRTPLHGETSARSTTI